jgi:inner membrane protease ATP23
MTAGYILGSFDNYDDFVSTTTDIYKEDAAPDINDALDAEEKPGEYKYQKMIEKPGVVVCQDVMALYPSPSEYTNQVLHELVHAFDDCRAKINWHNCDQIACAEIRASGLSGECRYKIERARGKAGIFSGVTGQMQECVRRRALLSVKNSRYCQGKDCEAIVDKHFTKCFADVEPFVERP